MAWLVYGEVATWVSAAGCAISLLGVVFIAQPPFLFGGNVQYDMTHWLGMYLPAIKHIAVMVLMRDSQSWLLAAECQKTVAAK